MPTNSLAKTSTKRATPWPLQMSPSAPTNFQIRTSGLYCQTLFKIIQGWWRFNFHCKTDKTMPPTNCWWLSLPNYRAKCGSKEHRKAPTNFVLRNQSKTARPLISRQRPLIFMKKLAINWQKNGLYKCLQQRPLTNSIIPWHRPLISYCKTNQKQPATGAH